MITYVQLEDFLTKCKTGLEQVNAAYKQTLEELAVIEQTKRMQEEQAIAIESQILTIEQLMDTENNPPKSELPFAGEEIEELHDKRLDGRKDMTPKEAHQEREDVYLMESLDTVEQIDELNETSKEAATGTNPEVDS